MNGATHTRCYLMEFECLSGLNALQVLCHCSDCRKWNQQSPGLHRAHMAACWIPQPRIQAEGWSARESISDDPFGKAYIPLEMLKSSTFQMEKGTQSMIDHTIIENSSRNHPVSIGCSHPGSTTAFVPVPMCVEALRQEMRKAGRMHTGEQVVTGTLTPPQSPLCVRSRGGDFSGRCNHDHRRRREHCHLQLAEKGAHAELLQGVRPPFPPHAKLKSQVCERVM